MLMILIFYSYNSYAFVYLYRDLEHTLSFEEIQGFAPFIEGSLERMLLINLKDVLNN